MKLSELAIGATAYTQLGSRVLAVLCRRHDGWCVYVDAVPGENHDREQWFVQQNGNKQYEAMARAIVTHLFYPGFEIDLPYAP